MMKIPVILSSLLFAIVSSKISSQTSNKYIVEQKGPETWLERVNIVDEETISNDVEGKKSSLEDGRQKSRAKEAGLTRWEMGSVQEASSGTDWGGLLLRLADRQESAREKRNLPSLISLLRPKPEKSDFTLRKSHENRQRRSLEDYHIADYMLLTQNLNNEDEVQKILANAKAHLSTVKSDNMGKFRNNPFGDDWLSFVLPFRSGMGFTESLLRPSNANYDLGIQNWNENEKWVDDTKFLNANKFLQNNEDMEIDKKDAFSKNYVSSLLNEGRSTGYSDELTETSLITKQAEDGYDDLSLFPESRVKEASKDGSGTTEETYETDAASPTKDNGKDSSGRNEEKYKEAFGSRLEEPGEYGSDTQANKEGLIKNDERRNEDGNYRDTKINVDIKNKETLLDDISIDNTMNNVVGSDKLSTAELPVKILRAHDKTNQNKRPWSDESLFISDPFVLRTKWEGDSRHEKEDEESKTVDESNSMKVDQNMQGRKLISNEIRDEPYQDVKSSLQDRQLINKETQDSYRDSKLPNDEADFNESIDIPRARNKMDEKMISMEKEKSIVTTQEKKDSSELKIPRLLDESSDLREQMQRRQNLYQGNEKNLSLNSWRIDGSPATDTRKGIQQEYDKQKSAAETSIRVDANKRGRVKHRERIGTKSTSTEEMPAENEERRKSLNHDGQQSEMEGRNVPSADRADYTVDSDENVKLERTSLEEREEAIADVKSREEKSDVGNLKEKKHDTEDPETAEFEFDVNSNEFEVENLKNTEYKMKYLGGKYSTEEILRMQKSEVRNKENVEGDDINRGKFGLENVEKEKSKEESDKKKEHDISGTKKTKFEVENSQGKKLRLQDVNEGDKLESKGLKRKKFDPEISAKRKFEAESSQMGNVKLNFGPWDVAGQKFESTDLQERKSEQRNVDNDKFETGDLKEKEVGPEYRGEREYGPIVTQEKSGSMNVETEKFKPSVEVFKPQLREDNLLLTSDEVSTKNDKNIEQFDPRDTQINIKQGKKIVQQDEESSEKEKDEFNKNVEEMNKNLEENIKKYIKYKQYEIDRNLTVKTKDDEIFKEDPWNNDSHATHDDAFEISNKESELRKKEYEITSGEESLNVDEEPGISENKSKENEEVISYEGAIHKDTSADKTSGGKYKLKEDHIVTNKRKYEADMTKGIGLSSIEEEMNEASSKNEEEREKLSLGKEILGKRDFKIKSDTLEDNDKKDVKSNQIFDENTSSVEENNVLVKRTQLQADRTLSGITDIAEEGPFVNAGIHEKNNRARVLSAKTNTKEKEPFNDPRIYQEIYNTEPLENNEKHIIRTKERKPNKLSKYQTDGIRTLNIESNQFSNDNIIISKKNNSANKINEILQEYENSEKTLLRDSEVNQATNLSSISIGTGSPTDPRGNDESSTATIEAHVAKLQDGNKELLSGGNDTSTTPDENRIEILANFGKLNNIDVHALRYSDRLNEDNNPSPATHEVSLEENVPGKNKIATLEGASSENTQEEAKEGRKEIIKDPSISNSSASGGEESKTAKETHVIGGTKEKYGTQAGNEVDNTLETLNETVDRSVINLTGFPSDESKEFSSKERPEEIGSVFYNSNEESNFSDVRITNSPVFIDKTDHETIDPNESSQKYIKSDRESINAALTKIENLEKEYYAKKKIDEASKLNSNIDTSTESLIKTKELDLLGKHKDKIVANDVNLEQATESFSAWSSKFSGNSGISGEDNISSTAINQGYQEETEKEEITGRNTAEDHSSKHNDLKMISNLSVISNGSTEMGEENKERNSTITDEKLDSGNLKRKLSNVARLLTNKNSAEIMNYYETKGNSNNFIEYGKINKSDRKDLTKEAEIDISGRSNEYSIGITQKQAVTTGKSRLNDPYAKETEQKASLNESESITWDLNKEKAPVEVSHTSIEVTESNDAARESKESLPTVNMPKMWKNKVLLSDLSGESLQKNDKLEKNQHETLNNSNLGETRSKEDEITKLRTKMTDKYATPSAARQLIENEVLGTFSETSTQPALNISEARSPDIHENTIKSRLLEAATLRPLNWTDNEGYKDPLVEASWIHKDTLSTGTYDPDAMHLSKLDPRKKLSEIVKVSNEKVKSLADKVENIPKETGYGITYNNMKKLGGDEEEKVAENIFNGFNDISVESNNERMGTIEDNKFMNSIVDTSYPSVSLNESDYRIDGEVNAKRQEKIDLSYEDDLLGVRKNENIKNTGATDILDQKYDLNEKYSELNVYDEDYKPKIITITNATQNYDNLLKNGKQEENPLLKLLLNKANDIQNLNNEVKGSRTSDNSFEKNNEFSEARTKIKLDELNKETSEGKAAQESESYEDKLHLSEQRISQSTENLYEISEDGKETQIQKALTEAEIAVTELPRVKEQQQKNILEKKEETYTKAGDKHISSENHLEDPDRRNVSWNQLNPMEITDSKSNDEISLKQHYNPKIQGTSSNLEDIDSEILIRSDSTSNTIMNDLQNKYKDLALDINDDSPQKMTYDSNKQDELKLNSKEMGQSGTSIKSYYTSNVTENNIHNQYQNPILTVSEPLKLAYESKIQKLLLNSENDTNSSVSIGSGYTSNAIASDLHNALKDPVISASNSKKAIYDSNAQDESGLNSNVAIGSGYTSNVIASDLHNALRDPAISASNSKKAIYDSNAQDESGLSSNVAIGSGYTSNVIASDLYNTLKDPAINASNSKKAIYDSNAQDESGLSSNVAIGSGYTSNVIASDLYNTLKDPAINASNSKKAIYDSNAQDESGLNSSVSIGSGYTSNVIASDLHNELRDPSISASNSKKAIYDSNAQDESGLNSNVAIGSGYTSNVIASDLHNALRDPAISASNSKKAIYDSNAQDESGLSSNVAIGSGYTSNVIASDLHNALRDPVISASNSKKAIYDSNAQDESGLNSNVAIGSGYTSNVIASDLHNELRDPSISASNSKKAIYDSNAQDESGLSSNVAIGSGYTSNGIASDLHNTLKDSATGVSNSKKVIYDSYAQDESGLNSSVSIGSGYTSNGIASDLHNALKDSVTGVSNSKKVIYDSYPQDESGLNSNVAIGSGYTSNVIASDLHNALRDPSISASNSKKVIYDSNAQDESGLSSNVAIGSGYTSNGIASDLHNTLKDPAISASNSKKVIYDSYESGLNSKEKAVPDISAESYFTVNAVKSDSHNKSKNPAISANDSKKVSYGSKVKDTSKLTLEEDGYSDISVKSYYTSDPNKYDLHSEFQEPTLIRIDPLKMNKSNIQDESKLDSKEETDFGISGESPYASGADKNDLHNENQDLTLAVSDPKKLTYKSSIYDETKSKLKEDLTRKLDSNEEADSIMSTEPYSDLHTESNDSPISVSDELAKVLYKSNIDNKPSFDSKKDADSGSSVKSYSIWNTANSDLHNKPKDSAATLNDSKKVIHESSVEDNSKENIDTDIPVKSYFTSDVQHDLHSQYQNPELVVLEPLRITYESKIPEHSIHDTKEHTDSDISNKSQYTSSIVNSNLRNEFRDPAQTDSKKNIERHNLKTIANSENIVENESTQFIKDGKTLSISELPDQSSSFTIFEERPEVNARGVNALSNIPVIGGSTDAHRSLGEKGKSTKSNNLLSRVSGTILSGRDGEEIPDAKFVKKLQPSSRKLAKSWAEIANKSESFSPVSSKKFKSHSDEAESATSVKSSSYKTLDKVLETGDANNNLCDILRSSFLFTHFQDDAWDNEVSSTYDVSTDVLPSNVANVKSKSYESASMLQESNEDKVDVYIVKQTFEGPVKIAHVENMEPLIVTTDEISKSIYDSIVNIFNGNRIKSGSSAT